jgi:prepilin-type N-terminal cleavage/methylation domain-containing protein
MFKVNTNNKGFTLIELLIVMAILSILTSIIIPKLSDSRAKARDVRREMDIKNIQTTLANYYLENGYYPMTHWRFSYNSSDWESLSNTLGQTLPIDPKNESISPISGGFSYSYFALNNADFCSGQAYMIVFNKETKSGNLSYPQDGVKFCNNSIYGYNNSFVVGVSPVQ